jgi:hypothetical protein
MQWQTIAEGKGQGRNDHVIPLKRGGADAPWNMQWQTIAEGKAKDATACAVIAAALLSPNLGEARGGGGGGHGHASNYCTICARDSHGRMARSLEARHEFMTQDRYPMATLASPPLDCHHHLESEPRTARSLPKPSANHEVRASGVNGTADRDDGGCAKRRRQPSVGHSSALSIAGTSAAEVPFS